MNRRTLVRAVALLSVAACSRASQEVSSAGSAAQIGTPPSQGTAAEQLSSSPRRGQWVMIPAGEGDSVRAWVVYPQRSTRAPVVLAVHDIAGMGPWIRAVADQLAEDGFVGIAPDLLTGKGVPVDADGHHTGSTIGFRTATRVAPTWPSRLEHDLRTIRAHGRETRPPATEVTDRDTRLL